MCWSNLEPSLFLRPDQGLKLKQPLARQLILITVYSPFRWINLPQAVFSCKIFCLFLKTLKLCEKLWNFLKLSETFVWKFHWNFKLFLKTWNFGTLVPIQFLASERRLFSSYQNFGAPNATFGGVEYFPSSQRRQYSAAPIISWRQTPPSVALNIFPAAHVAFVGAIIPKRRRVNYQVNHGFSHLASLKKTPSCFKDAMWKSTRNFLKKDRTKTKFFIM